MSPFDRFLPEPGGVLDTGAFMDEPWFRALYDCPQDPVFHAEGNVGVHTEMVIRELTALDTYAKMTSSERLVVFTAALLHDVAKPSTTTNTPEGRVTAPGHSRRGAIDARGILWRAGMDFETREHVCAIIEDHQTPFFAIKDGGYRGRIARLSQTLRCDLLAAVTEADGRGRICPDLTEILENIELFREAAREEGCLDRLYPFPSAHTRVIHSMEPRSRTHCDAVYDDRSFTVWLTAGLPGSGKDTAIQQFLPDMPMVSLDGIRRELGISPLSNQGAVIQEAQRRARDFLRQKRSFVWNATHLSRQQRERAINLLHAYGARIHILYTEAAPDLLFKRNREREHPVPEKVIQSMLLKWEPPRAAEAHEVICCIHENEKSSRQTTPDAAAQIKENEPC